MRHHIERFLLRHVPVEPIAQVVTKSSWATDKILKSRQMRLEAQPEGDKNGFKYYALTTASEFVPLPFLPVYGVGDALSLIEGLRGEQTTGQKIDKIDKWIFIGAAVVPIIPAIPLRELIRMKRKELEEVVFKRNSPS